MIEAPDIRPPESAVTGEAKGCSLHSLVVPLRAYYEDALVTIYNGEALNTMNALPSGIADVLMTDPPYSSGGMFRSDRNTDPKDKYRGWSHSPEETRKPAAEYGTFAGDNRDQRSWACWVSAWSWSALRLTKEGGSAFVFSDWRQLPAATDAVQLGGWTWRGVVVWDKGVGRPVKGCFRNHVEYVVWATHGKPSDEAEGYPSAIISVPTVRHGEREHVTQKPVELLRHLLSIVPNKTPLVLDPFMGSGSTLVAAKQMGVRAIGIELDEKYCEMAAKRCASEMAMGEERHNAKLSA
jgi:site-specific DNA-methyltransferase (adenine-specific)